MGLPYQTLQKSYFYFLEDFTKKHIDLLRKSRVFIFGAGNRGRSVLWMLKAFQITNICFVDNNVNKQNSYMDGCAVISFEEADKYSGKHVFLCPVEHGRSILEQLGASGRMENIDYFNLDFYFTDYLDLVTELKEPASDYALLFGCCVLSSCILETSMLPMGGGMSSRLTTPSLGETMRKQFCMECKLCTLPGFYPAIYYYTINACLHLQKEPPRLILMLMEVSSLSPYAPLVMGTQNYQQHKDFVEQLVTIDPDNQELRKYLQKVNERLERSMKGSSPTKAYNTPEMKRRVYKLKYLYNLCETDESVVYTKRILTKMKDRNIPVILLFPPVDYQCGEAICGNSFKEEFSAVVEKMRSFLDGFCFSCIDASFIADSNYFVPPPCSPDINPFLNAEGQKLLIDFLRRQPALKPFLNKIEAHEGSNQMIIKPKNPDELMKLLSSDPLILYGMGDTGRRIAKWCEAHGIKYLWSDKKFDELQKQESTPACGGGGYSLMIFLENIQLQILWFRPLYTKMKLSRIY